ncbi:MAG: cytochrome P450 [Oxalobacteraceae bacterium]|nr:MAG: cytochrome P450 [Oxalobacteraceae bacterium]
MSSVAELDLPVLPVEEHAFSENPYRFVREAKLQHPWLATSSIGLLIHDYTAIRDLLGDDKKFRPAYDGIVEQLGAQGTPWGRFTEEQLVSAPSDQHQLLRGIFAGKFTPRFANQLRPMMRARITRLLDEWAPAGAFDFEEFASYFPISNMFSLIGAPVEGVALVRDSLETLGLALSMDKTKVAEINEAYLTVEGYIRQLIADRREDPEAGDKDDLLNLLVSTSDSGRVGERELVDILIFFFIGGYDTSKNMLTNMMWQLLDKPEMYEHCAQDLEFCGKVVEEGLRYYNPGSIPRFTAQDVTYRGTTIPKDTLVYFNVNIAGRDSSVFDNPDEFNPDRELEPTQRHVAFGLGKHMCLGQYIARAQLQEGLHQIAQRIREPRLAGTFDWRPFPGIWGLKGLPIEFTPAPAASVLED